MYPIDFTKSRAEEILTAIDSGEPIPAPSASSPTNTLGGWNRYELLHVAGACYFAALSHGPPTSDLETLRQQPLEHREAAEETLYEDLHDAIELYSHLTMLVRDITYDDQHEPRFQGIVRRTADGQKTIIPVKGNNK